MNGNRVAYEVEIPRIDEPVYAAEVIDVYCWRFEQLREAGYTHSISDALATNGTVDLHVACDLLAHGCPEDTAVRILS